MLTLIGDGNKRETLGQADEFLLPCDLLRTLPSSSSIDPDRNDLLFERFVSEERREPPVDFEHERRETVMQWVFDPCGRDHAALIGAAIGSIVSRVRCPAAS
jgi:hypothetical protein